MISQLRRATAIRCERTYELRRRTLARGAHFVSRKGLEQIHSLLKEIWDLLLALIIRIAGSIQSANASSMLSPFMFPKRLIIPVYVFPIRIHIIEEVGLAE